MEIPQIAHFSGPFGYALAALFSLLESIAFVGLVIPAAVLMVLLGGLAREGIMNFWVLSAVTALTGFIGDVLSYELGRHGGALLHRWPRLRPHVEQARHVFHGHAVRAVILGRFVGALRPVVPFVAGMSHMRRLRFYVADFVSCIGWAVSYLGTGYVFGEAAGHALESPYAIVAIFALIAVVYGIHRLITRRLEA